MGCGERRGGTIDQSRGWCVADETHRQLRRNMSSSRGMRGDDVEYALAFVHAAGLDGLAEHDLLAAIVPPWGEHESRALTRLHRPTGKRLRDIDDVVLRVAAVNAERVELQ